MNIHLETPDAVTLDIEELLQLSGNSLMHYAPQYLIFLAKILPHTEVSYLTVRHHGVLQGILPVAICSDNHLGTVINSLPFFGSHGGPLCTTTFHTNTDTDKTRSCLMQAFQDLINARQAVSATLIENPFHPCTPEIAKTAGVSYVDDRIGQFTPLPQVKDNVKEAILAQCHVKTRNSIRKGQKYGQKIEQRSDLKSLRWLQAIHEKSITRLGGIPKQLSIFQTLIATFGNQARLYIGELDGVPASGLFILLYGNTVEYFTPVVAEEHKHKQLLSSLIFTVMTELSKEDFTQWNWGGTWRSQEGVYRFKSRWGAKDHVYRYFNSVTEPVLVSQPKDTLHRAFPFFYLFKY